MAESIASNLPTFIPADAPHEAHLEVYHLGGTTQFDRDGNALVFYPGDRSRVIQVRTEMVGPVASCVEVEYPTNASAS